MKIIVLLVSTLIVATTVFAQGFRVNVVGRGEMPETVDISSAQLVCASKCSIENVTVPDNAVEVILTVEYGGDDITDYEETINVVAKQGQTSTFTTTSNLSKSTGNTFSVKFVDENDLVIASTSDDDVQVLGSLVAKINSFTDDDDDNDTDIVGADLTSTLGLTANIKSDITTNIDDLNAQLLENTHGCDLTGGDNATDTAIGDYLECVMREHYIDELIAVHTDVTNPTVTEDTDDNIEVALSSNIKTLCAELIWMCTVTTGTQDWSLDSPATTVELSADDVSTITSDYDNALNGTFDLQISLGSGYATLSSDDSTKTYSNIEVPAPAIVAELTAASPEVSAATKFDELYASDSTILADLKSTGNLALFNTALAGSHGCTAITATATKGQARDFVTCVMESHYTGVASTMVAASYTVEEESNGDLTIDLPSQCETSTWTCTLSETTSHGWESVSNEAKLTQSEVLSATSTYANALNSTLSLSIALNTSLGYDSISNTKSYSSVSLPAHSILAKLLAGNDSNSSDFDNLGLESDLKTLITANLSLFNSEIDEHASDDECSEDSEVSITSSSSRSDIAEYVECVMRSHYVDLAEAVTIGSDLSASGNVCSSSSKGPIPSICSDSDWSCSIKSGTASPSSWSYTDNNNSNTKPSINKANSNGTAITDAAYTIVASLNRTEFTDSYSKDFGYTGITINANLTTNSNKYTNVKTFTGSNAIVNGWNYCVDLGARPIRYTDLNLKSGCSPFADTCSTIPAGNWLITLEFNGQENNPSKINKAPACGGTTYNPVGLVNATSSGASEPDPYNNNNNNNEYRVNLSSSSTPKFKWKNGTSSCGTNESDSPVKVMCFGAGLVNACPD